MKLLPLSQTEIEYLTKLMVLSDTDPDEVAARIKLQLDHALPRELSELEKLVHVLVHAFDKKGDEKLNEMFSLLVKEAKCDFSDLGNINWRLLERAEKETEEGTTLITALFNELMHEG